ncbi:hypothetical protein BFL28_11420 [Sphingomonas turrisvirgatae]|uniref:Uncharacterized protein n=1 Tax=Sphingomonas turrisvirgatae TaxID=1888892 RepID=A0A1E3LZG2_9SPHN|nr:hypothetical protein BFL28_11420 [Sphingomonas turrisvirgatae]
MIGGQRVDRGRTGVGKRAFGLEEIQLTELAFAVADPRDPRGFLRRGKRRSGRVAGCRRRIRNVALCRGDGLFRIERARRRCASAWVR